MGANPGKRPSPQDVITKLRRSPGFFKNDLIDIVLFLEEMQIKEEGDKSRFFTSLPGLLDNCPSNVCQVRRQAIITKLSKLLKSFSLKFLGQDSSTIDQRI